MVNSLQKKENIQSKSIARIETQLKQVADILKEGKSQSQLMTNPNGHYMEDESTSYHEQAITLRSEEVEERKEEKIKVP